MTAATPAPPKQELTQEQRAVLKTFDMLLRDIESALAYIREQKRLGLR